MVSVKETGARLILSGPNDELEKLSDAYAVRPPEYWRSPKFVLWKQTNGEKGWDGFLHPLKVRGTQGILGRGLLTDLTEKAAHLGLKLDLAQLLPRPFAAMVPDDLPTDLVVSPYPDFPHQRELVYQWLRHTIGVGEISVSGGKTRSFCMVAEMIRRRSKVRVLYLVPTERLVKQACKDAREFLPTWKVSQFGGDKREKDGDMVIATNAIIGRNFVELGDWLRSFAVLLVDECHHAASPTLQKIITAVPAYFKFGASDSAKEDDPIKGLEIQGLLGPVLTRMRAGPLIESGALAKPTLYVVDIKEWQDEFAQLPHQADADTPAWVYLAETWKKATYLGPAVERDAANAPRLDKKGKEIQLPSTHRLRLADGVELDVDSRWCLLERSYDRAIIRNRKRNELIYAWGKHYSDTKERTLIVATRTLHVLILQAGLEKVVDPALIRILFSDHTTRERDETFDWLRETPGGILISPLVKEGVSIPELTAGIVADYVGSFDLMNQLIGRLIRKKRHRDDNTAKLTIFIDRQVPAYRRGSLNIFRELQQTRGYATRHPVAGPDSIDMALHYEMKDD